MSEGGRDEQGERERDTGRGERAVGGRGWSALSGFTTVTPCGEAEGGRMGAAAVPPARPASGEREAERRRGGEGGERWKGGGGAGKVKRQRRALPRYTPKPLPKTVNCPTRQDFIIYIHII